MSKGLVRLRGKSKKGKERIKMYGDLWYITKVDEDSLVIRPKKPFKYARRYLLSKDTHMEIIEEVKDEN